MKLRAEQRVSVEEQDIAALRAFHVCPHARVVAVLRNGAPLFFDSPVDINLAVPEYWHSGLKFYTPSFVLGDGSWWRWIRGLHGGKISYASRPSEDG
jgi:hypothetical protein